MRPIKEHDEIGEHLVFIYEKLKDLYDDAVCDGWSERFSKSLSEIKERIADLKDEET